MGPLQCEKPRPNPGEKRAASKHGQLSKGCRTVETVAFTWLRSFGRSGEYFCLHFFPPPTTNVILTYSGALKGVPKAWGTNQGRHVFCLPRRS